MRERPADLDDGTLSKGLFIDYGLEVSALTFLPLGHDASAFVYRAVATHGEYFVKVRTSITNEAALLVPHHLAAQGIGQVVAPLATVSGTLWARVDHYAVIVYPYISERTGMMDGMSDRQWVESGAVMRQVHDARVPADLSRVLRIEGFKPDGSDALRRLDGYLDDHSFAETGQATIATMWHAKRDTILRLLGTAEAMGRRLALAPPLLVLCHADIHTNNVLVLGDEHVWLTDWDETMLAPRERDLMFVIEGIGPGFVDERRTRLFFDGYGVIDIDRFALTYYRYAWAIADIASYGDQVFLRPDLGRIDFEEAVASFQGLFELGSIVDIALGSAIG